MAGLRLDERFHRHAELTMFEFDSLGWLRRGLDLPEIADALSVPIAELESGLTRLQTKTGTQNLHSLVLWATVHADCCRDRRGG